MKKVAKKLQKAGRKGDTILAHINPAEAALLDRVTDGGSRNPKTGLLEFEDADSAGTGSGASDAGGGAEAGGAGSGGGYGGGGGGDYGYGQLSEAEKSQLANFAGTGATVGGLGAGGAKGDYGYGELTDAEKTAFAGHIGNMAGPEQVGGYSEPTTTQSVLHTLFTGLIPGYSLATRFGGLTARDIGRSNALTGSGQGNRGPDGSGGGLFGGGGGVGGLLGGLPTAPAVRARIARPVLTRKWGQPRGLLGG